MTWLLIALIAILQTVDVVTTVRGLRLGMEEANPLGRFLFEKFGTVPAAIIGKLLLTIPIVVFAIFYPDWWPIPALYAASLVWVVWHNLRSIRAG